MSKFWEKVYKCKHKNLNPNYCETIWCTCKGKEYHCLDCGIYTIECLCGEYTNSLSGWNYKRRKGVK